MNHRDPTSFVPLLVAASLATIAAHVSAGGIAMGEDPPVPDEAIFRLAPGVSLATELAALDQQFPGTLLVGEIASRSTYKVLVPPGTSPVALQNALQKVVQLTQENEQLLEQLEKELGEIREHARRERLNRN